MAILISHAHILTFICESSHTHAEASMVKSMQLPLDSIMVWQVMIAYTLIYCIHVRITPSPSTNSHLLFSACVCVPFHRFHPYLLSSNDSIHLSLFLHCNKTSCILAFIEHEHLILLAITKDTCTLHIMHTRIIKQWMKHPIPWL